MSNPDSFINEVTEEVRRDRVFRLMRRYGGWAVLVIVLVVAGAGWNEWRKAQERAEAEAFGSAVLTALEADDPVARRDALADLSAEGRRGAVLRLLHAAQAVEAEDPGAAAELLAAIEADNTLPETYRQLAMLKRMIVAAPDIPNDERVAALQSLAQPGAPFRPLALEQLALAELERGDEQAAIESLRNLLDLSEVTPGLRQRATQLMVALGAEPEAQG